jgi:transposase
MEEEIANVVKPKKKLRHPTEADKLAIIKHYDSSKSYHAVAKALGWSRTTVRRICKKYASSNSLSRTKGQGRKRKTSHEEDLAIISAAKKNKGITAKEILESIVGPKVGVHTIRRRIKSDAQLSIIG